MLALPAVDPQDAVGQHAIVRILEGTAPALANLRRLLAEPIEAVVAEPPRR